MTEPLPGHAVAVARDDAHRFSKPIRESITLIAGIGARVHRPRSPLTSLAVV
ncbi:hypothetical protein [Microbacterium atlanticum]|uniref:hypothetical protein n=1 Tax=Microbacterium atlanticum TaxID=2782168 RepID=UPI001E33FCA5|nr:hypothetical protein [Microbacterium atlanticum]